MKSTNVSFPKNQQTTLKHRVFPTKVNKKCKDSTPLQVKVKTRYITILIEISFNALPLI